MENQILQLLNQMNTKLDNLEKQNQQMQNSMIEQEKELTNLYQLLALLLEDSGNGENPLVQMLKEIGLNIENIQTLLENQK